MFRWKSRAFQHVFLAPFMKKHISIFAVLLLLLFWANAHYEVVAFNWGDDELSDDSFRIMVYNVNGTVEDTIHEDGVCWILWKNKSPIFYACMNLEL